MVKNSEEGSGLDSWRRLCKEYDPVTAPSKLRLLRQLLHPKPVPQLRNLVQAIEGWERQLKEYIERSKEPVSDSTKRLSIMAMCPEALQEHLDFNSAR